MRNIYIAVLTFLTLGLLLFILSFFYLDITKHRTYHFSVNADGRDVGTVRVDKFTTEDKLIYKSVTSMPFAPQFTEYRTRLDLDRKYNLQSYTRERAAGRSTDVLYIENFKGSASFVSRYQSRFACAEGIPAGPGTFVFEEDRPVAYLPLLENYNFASGRSQGFAALIVPQAFNMPPMKRFVILTSIRDEIIKIGSRRIKTENLVVKIRDLPQAHIWVAKSDRALIRLEIPSQNLRITRTFRPRPLTAKEYRPAADGIVEKEISIASKGAQLAGTLSMPAADGKFPAVLLVWAQGPQDRYYQGFFASIARYLAKNGFCVLSMDKRGTGESSGDSAGVAETDIDDDIGAAVAFLSAHERVDPAKIGIIGHGRGAFYAMKAAIREGAVRGIVLMNPSISNASDAAARLDALRASASKYRWSDDYLALVARTIDETEAKAASTKGDWAFILGKKCFMANVRNETLEKPMDTIARIRIPVLILQGGKDDDMPGESASFIDKALADAGNQSRTVTYYAYLGQFLADAVDDGAHRIHYEADKQVLENIQSWLAKIFSQSAAAPAEAAPALPRSSQGGAD